jgi:anti-sigma factor ChrR (cupin superfamily)
MTHYDEDRLLLFAYGELAEADAAGIETHLTACAECHARFARLELARAAAQLVLQPAGQRRGGRWSVVGAGLVSAAAIAAAVLALPRDSQAPERAWRPPSVWSATAGYIAGGPSVVEIDAQLTRLEKERYHGLPN